MVLESYKKFEDAIAKKANSLWKLKFMKLVRNLLLSGLFCYGIKSLTDFDSVLYQTHKDAATAKALVAFLLFLFIVRKVRLINPISLLVTVAYVPFAVNYLKEVVLSPDILAIREPWVIIYWLILMIVVDWLAYKRQNPLYHIKLLPTFLFLFAGIFMATHSNGTQEGIVMLIPFSILFATPLNREEWENLIKRVCDGWFMVYVWLVGKSYLENYPYTTARFYGCFTNIGAFGAFLLCSLVICIFGMYYLRKTYGKRNKMLWINYLWLASILVTVLFTFTFTMFAGVILVLLGLWLFVRKDISKRTLLKRVIILAVGFTAMVVFLWLVSRNAEELAAYWNAKYWEDTGNMFSYLMFRFYRSFVPDADYSGIISMGLMKYDGLLQVINNFSSGRIMIWEEFAQHFNFSGNPSNALEVGNYIAFGAHCEFIQTIYRFGWLGGGVNIILYLYGFYASLKGYLRERKWMYFMAVIWLLAMFGVWLGESNNILYPITFTGLFFLYPVMCTVKEK